MRRIRTGLRRIREHQGGATAIEYGLIAALIAVVLIAGAGSVGKNVGAVFNKLANNVATGTGS